MQRNLLIIIVLTVIVGGGLFLFLQKKQPMTAPNPSQAHQQNEYPAPAKLAERLEMGVVELNVSDLDEQAAFYESAVGLDVLSESKDQVTLGYEDREVIRLVLRNDLEESPVGSAGLYHTATVFESRAALAQAVKRVLEQYPELYSGTSDHVVSEAFYFTDPEGNGVELYFDKDPNGWQWRDGKVVMGSEYIDPERYIKTHESTSASEGKKMGHVHLRVGNISEAKTFYEDVVGFAETALMPTALFISDGKYHHHLGMNVWESNGAGKREETLGLKSYELFVPESKNIEALKARLNEHNVEFVEIEKGVEFNDPWNNTVIVRENTAVFVK